MGNDVVFATTLAVLWFWIGWRIRGEREIRRQGEVLRSMMDILQAQTAQRDGLEVGVDPTPVYVSDEFIDRLANTSAIEDPAQDDGPVCDP